MRHVKLTFTLYLYLSMMVYVRVLRCVVYMPSRRHGSKSIDFHRVSINTAGNSHAVYSHCSVNSAQALPTRQYVSGRCCAIIDCHHASASACRYNNALQVQQPRIIDWPTNGCYGNLNEEHTSSLLWRHARLTAVDYRTCHNVLIKVTFQRHCAG